jgi:hypothetical protein
MNLVTNVAFIKQAARRNSVAKAVWDTRCATRVNWIVASDIFEQITNRQQNQQGHSALGWHAEVGSK